MKKTVNIFLCIVRCIGAFCLTVHAFMLAEQIIKEPVSAQTQIKAATIGPNVKQVVQSTVPSKVTTITTQTTTPITPAATVTSTSSPNPQTTVPTQVPVETTKAIPSASPVITQPEGQTTEPKKTEVSTTIVAPSSTATVTPTDGQQKIVTTTTVPTSPAPTTTATQPQPVSQTPAPVATQPSAKPKRNARQPRKPKVPVTPLGPPETPVTISPTQADKGITEIVYPETIVPPIVSMADIPKTPFQKEVQAQALQIPETGLTKSERKDDQEVLQRLRNTGEVFLGQYTAPWLDVKSNDLIEMNFENKEISGLLKFLEDNLNITFILDDYIEPHRTEGMQPLAGTKISFKSNVPLSLRQVWELGTTFLEMAGFSIIPTVIPRTYRVTLSASRDKPSANREPLPTFIGTDPNILPDSDLKIRYVYFVENAELGTVAQIIDTLKSASAGPLIEFPQLRAVMITDKSASIKSLVQVLQEIDRVTLPETLSIIRLKHTDARTVRELYYRLIGKDPSNPVFNPFGRQRKPTTTQYFSEATRVFEEPRTNSLIVLGTRDNIRKFEDFVIKHIDRTLELPFSPLHIIQLKYIDAASIAKILNDVIQKFNADPANAAAAAVGGVRDNNKFFRPSVRITEESSGNRLIINADYDEYLKLRKIIDDLDVEQPQVAIKVLVLNVDITDNRQLGTQLRNSINCCDGTGGTTPILGSNINFQSAQLGPLIPRDTTSNGTTVNGAERLLGNLIALATSAGQGSTLVSLGQDIFGVFGLLQALQSLTRVSIVANPFLVTSHKYRAEVKIGTIERVQTAIVQGQTATLATGDLPAMLRVVVTPQISFDNMVTLTTYVELSQFTGTSTDVGPTRIERKVSTEALLANAEVLALGGLIQDNVTETETKVPLLGDIPLIGWLFKNKIKTASRTSLLILISPEIIKPHDRQVAQRYTYAKINDAKETIYQMRNSSYTRDPIHRWFFNDHKTPEVANIDKFASTQQRYLDESHKPLPGPIALKEKRKKPRKKDSLLEFIEPEAKEVKA